MALKILVISLAIWIPSMAMAQCLTWLICPYVKDELDPSTRYLSLYDMRIRDFEVEIEKTEVAGTEALGRAVICIKSANVDKTQIEAQSRSIGCEVKEESEVRELMVSPFSTRLNPRTGEIEIQDGSNNGREKRPIRVSPRMRDEVRGTR